MNVGSPNTATPSLKLLTGTHAGKLFPLDKPSIAIGRDPLNDVCIEGDPYVSRTHARLDYVGSQWRIQKAKSGIVLQVNQRSVETEIVSNNDIITLSSNVKLLFLQPSQQAQPLTPLPLIQPIQPIQPILPLQPTPPPPAVYTPPTPPMPQTPAVSPAGFGTGTERAIDPGVLRKYPFLEISISSSGLKETHLLTKEVMSVGRERSNDICISSNVVSRVHFQILSRQGQSTLIHPPPNASLTMNGLLYAGRHITGNTSFQRPLQHGDIIRIGEKHGELVTITYNDGSNATPEILPEVQPVVLTTATVTIGRYANNTMVLAHPQVSAHHARIEYIQGNRYIIDMNSTNHVFVNGRNVSRHNLSPNDEIRIGPFVLTYTGTALIQRDESKSIRIHARSLYRTVKKRSWLRTKELVLLNDISLCIKPRNFVALVGGSGAGKSTLLDALNGLKQAQRGSVLYNQQDFYTLRSSFSTQIGYVPQQDIIHQDLTVVRALYYAAKMRLPVDTTKREILQRIDEVLKAVDMAHRRTTMVKELSGGQKKRVSIALELLARPSVFFLDEPTSGLDPGLDHKMMRLLRNLADNGCTIVLVTHATSNIDFCDFVCFLARGGRIAFYGPPQEAKSYFGKKDFAEIYTELEPPDDTSSIPADAERKFRASSEYKTYIAAPLSQGVPSTAVLARSVQETKPANRRNALLQFLLLSMRYIELLKNDWLNLAILLGQAPFIGLILVLFIHFGIGNVGGAGGFDPTITIQCPVAAPVVVNNQPALLPLDQAPFTNCNHVLTFLNNDARGKAYAAQHGGTQQALQDFIVPGPGEAPKILFIIAFAAIMFGSINGTREIVKELNIYLRERAVNLGILPYMFSKIAVLGTLCLFQSLLLVFMVNWADPFKQSIFLWPPLEVYISTVLTSLVGLMMGLAVSAASPNGDRAMSIIPVILLPQVIFSGLLFPLKNIFMQVFGFLFPIRWAMAALGSTVGLHSDKLGKDALYGTNYTYHGTLFSTYSKPDAVLYLFSIWFVLAAMIVLLAFVVGKALKRKDVRV